MTDLVLSASSLDAYDDCHYRWYLQYVERHGGEQSVAAAIGLAVHRAIEEHYKRRMLSEPVPDRFLVDLYNFTYITETSGIADPELPLDKAMIWGRRALISYLEDVAPDVEPVLVEYGSELEVDGILVSGHLDVADAEGVVRDTKIKKTKPRDPSRYLRAFTIYALLYRDRMGKLETDVQLDVIVRLKRDRPYHVPYNYGGPVSDHDIATLAGSLNRVANGIAKGDYRPTGLEEGACRFCPVSNVCEYYQEERVSGR